jgi:putative endonuclease
MFMYTIYILRCADDSFYTGITTDLERRFKQHKQGTASHYTRAHGAVEMVYTEKKRTRSAALKREAAIKKLSRQQKQELVDSRS